MSLTQERKRTLAIEAEISRLVRLRDELMNSPNETRQNNTSERWKRWKRLKEYRPAFIERVIRSYRMALAEHPSAEKLRTLTMRKHEIEMFLEVLRLPHGPEKASLLRGWRSASRGDQEFREACIWERDGFENMRFALTIKRSTHGNGSSKLNIQGYAMRSIR